MCRFSVASSALQFNFHIFYQFYEFLPPDIPKATFLSVRLSSFIWLLVNKFLVIAYSYTVLWLHARCLRDLSLNVAANGLCCGNKIYFEIIFSHARPRHAYTVMSYVKVGLYAYCSRQRSEMCIRTYEHHSLTRPQTCTYCSNSVDNKIFTITTTH